MPLLALLARPDGSSLNQPGRADNWANTLNGCWPLHMGIIIERAKNTDSILVGHDMVWVISVSYLNVHFDMLSA